MYSIPMAVTQVRNQLQSARKARGWTAADLSAETKGEVPTGTIQKIERGAYAPNIQAALTLARALNTQVSSLFFLE